MAFVPELDDPSKDASAPTDDPSDLSAQASTSNIAAAPSAGGQSAAGGQVAAPSKSSGSFQDFSKFKAANQGKLAALSNLATDQAKSGVDNAKSAFDNAGSAYQTEIQKNAKNFETSQYKNLNKDSAIDADAITADLYQDPVKSETQQGQLAGSQEYTNLHNKTNQIQQLGTRAGTAAVLGDYNAAAGNKASAAAANQDSMLLQSMGDYRNKANTLGQGFAGTDTNALATQQKKLDDTANTVNANNVGYKAKALAALGGLQSNLQQDLTDRAKAAESERQLGLQGQVTSAQAEAAKAARLKAQQAVSSGVLADYMNNPNSPDAPKKYQAVLDAQAKLDAMGKMSDADVIRGTEFETPFQNFLAESDNQKINENNIYSADTTRQAQLSALQRLLGKGNSYSTGAMAPMASQGLSPLEKLIQDVKNNTPTGLAQPLQQTAAATPNAVPVDLSQVKKDDLIASAGSTVKTPVTISKTKSAR